jgi:hypothetical protein
VLAYIGDGTNGDSVLYGYGFRDHWMWFNGLYMDNTRYISFIIWKDYNCISWHNFNNNYDPSTSFNSFESQMITSAITSFASNVNKDDIWATTYQFTSYLEQLF